MSPAPRALLSLTIVGLLTGCGLKRPLTPASSPVVVLPAPSGAPTASSPAAPGSASTAASPDPSAPSAAPLPCRPAWAEAGPTASPARQALARAWELEAAITEPGAGSGGETVDDPTGSREEPDAELPQTMEAEDRAEGASRVRPALDAYTRILRDFPDTPEAARAAWRAELLRAQLTRIDGPAPHRSPGHRSPE